MKESPTDTIMIIDDQPENLNVLGGMLRQHGWEVSAFPRGEMALAAARREAPALILLDIRMPGMDGYEVCRQFKADESLQRIPIIFLSAFEEPSVKVKAFEVGGADYVSKPFAAVEVLARVRSQLALARQQCHLEELVRQRVQELAEAHQRLRIWDRAKNEWLRVLSHEMRTPLIGVFGVTDLLFSELPEDSQYHMLVSEYERSRHRIEKLVEDALTLAQIDVAAEDFELSSLPLAELIRRAADAVPSLLFGVDLASALAPIGSARVSGDATLLGRAFTDLMRSVAQCVENWEPITVASDITEGRAQVTIATSGKSLPSEALNTFFEVGGQRKLLKAGGDLGLGSALAKRAICLFDGTVSIVNGARRGIVIDVSLPVV
jgi:DNA-binding response OmpR family regulator